MSPWDGPCRQAGLLAVPSLEDRQALTRGESMGDHFAMQPLHVTCLDAGVYRPSGAALSGGNSTPSLPAQQSHAQALQHALSPFVLCLQHVLKAYLDENILVKLPKPHGSRSAAAIHHGEASSSDTAAGKAPVASNVVPFERPAGRLGAKQPKAKLPTIKELHHDTEQGQVQVRGIMGAVLLLEYSVLLSRSIAVAVCATVHGAMTVAVLSVVLPAGSSWLFAAVAQVGSSQAIPRLCNFLHRGNS